jgi:hypothetical protein
MTLASQGIDKYLGSLKPMTPAEIQESTNAFIIWTADNARLELRPAEYKTLTTSLETKDSFQQTWDQAYAFMSTFASNTLDHKSFYNKLHDALKSDTSANGSFLGILSAGVNANLQNDFDSLSAGEQLRIQQLYNQLKTGTSNKGSLMNSAYRKFNGEDFMTSTQPKSIEVYHVSASTFRNEIKSAATDLRRTGAANMARDTEFTLADASEGWQDGYMRIERELNDFRVQILRDTDLQNPNSPLSKFIADASNNANKNAIRVNQLLEWKRVDAKVQHPFFDEHLKVSFDRKVLDAVPVLSSFNYQYPGNRTEHNVAQIDAVLTVERIDGNDVYIRSYASMYDFGDHQARNDHGITFIVLARTEVVPPDPPR